MFKKNIGLLILMLASIHSYSQDLSAYEKHKLRLEEQFMPFRLLLPENYDANKKYPLIFFLHGYGERGDDNEKQLIHGSKLFLDKELRKKFPAIVVIPQCPMDSYWSNSMVHIKPDESYSFYFQTGGEPTKAMERAQAILDMIIHTYPVDKSRLYIGGLSMGGMGTFEMVRRNPGLFAAAFPICGGANPETAKNMTDTNWWIFHGEKDRVVPTELSETMARALKEAGADVKLTIYPDVHHNSWDPAFAEEDLLPWLFSNKK